MANETTFTAIDSRIPQIYQGALMYAQENFVMPQIVRNFMDSMDMKARNVYEYAAGTVVTSLAETTDLTTQAFSDASLSAITPAEIGTQFVVTDRRMEGDPQDVMADLTRHIGYTVFKQVEQHLTGDFSSFTGGTIYTGASTAAGTITWAKVYAARALLAAANVPPPYHLVVHEYQWLQLANVANIVGISSAAPLRIRDDIQSRYYVGSVGDMNVYALGSDGLSIPAGGTVYCGLFNGDALAFDVRRPMRIELERNASLRATEVNATMIYAHGVWRKSWGVAIKALAETPT